MDSKNKGNRLTTGEQCHHTLNFTFFNYTIFWTFQIFKDGIQYDGFYQSLILAWKTFHCSVTIAWSLNNTKLHSTLWKYKQIVTHGVPKKFYYGKHIKHFISREESYQPKIVLTILCCRIFNTRFGRGSKNHWFEFTNRCALSEYPGKYCAHFILPKRTNLLYGLINRIFAIGEIVNWRLDTYTDGIFNILYISQTGKIANCTKYDLVSWRTADM